MIAGARSRPHSFKKARVFLLLLLQSKRRGNALRGDQREVKMKFTNCFEYAQQIYDADLIGVDAG